MVLAMDMCMELEHRLGLVRSLSWVHTVAIGMVCMLVLVADMVLVLTTVDMMNIEHLT